MNHGNPPETDHLRVSPAAVSLDELAQQKAAALGLNFQHGTPYIQVIHDLLDTLKGTHDLLAAPAPATAGEGRGEDFEADGDASGGVDVAEFFDPSDPDGKRAGDYVEHNIKDDGWRRPTCAFWFDGSGIPCVGVEEALALDFQPRTLARALLSDFNTFVFVYNRRHTYLFQVESDAARIKGEDERDDEEVGNDEDPGDDAVEKAWPEPTLVAHIGLRYDLGHRLVGATFDGVPLKNVVGATTGVARDGQTVVALAFAPLSTTIEHESVPTPTAPKPLTPHRGGVTPVLGYAGSYERRTVTVPIE